MVSIIFIARYENVVYIIIDDIERDLLWKKKK